MVKRKIGQLKDQLYEEHFFDSEQTNVDTAVKKLEIIGEDVLNTKDRGMQLN